MMPAGLQLTMSTQDLVDLVGIYRLLAQKTRSLALLAGELMAPNYCCPRSNNIPNLPPSELEVQGQRRFEEVVADIQEHGVPQVSPERRPTGERVLQLHAPELK